MNNRCHEIKVLKILFSVHDCHKSCDPSENHKMLNLWYLSNMHPNLVYFNVLISEARTSKFYMYYLFDSLTCKC